MGGKYQLRAFRALTTALSKPQATFILDLDAAVDTKARSCLDGDSHVIADLRERGLGDRTLTKVIGELITLLRDYVRDAAASGSPIDAFKDPTTLTEGELAIALRAVRKRRDDGTTQFDVARADAILGKTLLVRNVAEAANVRFFLGVQSRPTTRVPRP